MGSLRVKMTCFLMIFKIQNNFKCFLSKTISNVKKLFHVFSELFILFFDKGNILNVKNINNVQNIGHYILH